MGISLNSEQLLVIGFTQIHDLKLIWAPLSSLLSSQITYRCCKEVSKTLPNGNVYNGEWKDGKPNRQGVMWMYRSGDVYIGEWKDGKPNGQGVMKYNNGDVHEGRWKDGKPNGQGVMKRTNGDFYKGGWKDGKPNGLGLYEYSSGDICKCEFQDGKPSGLGLYKYSNGDICKGEFQDGKENGLCLYKHSSGDFYQGECKDDKPNGQGVMFEYSNGIMVKMVKQKANGPSLKCKKCMTECSFDLDVCKLCGAELDLKAPSAGKFKTRYPFCKKHREYLCNLCSFDS